MKHQIKQEQLAEELAHILKDRESLVLYRSYTTTYPESFLRKLLGEVMEVPDNKIKKSRGALFSYLIQKYGHRPRFYTSD